MSKSAQAPTYLFLVFLTLLAGCAVQAEKDEQQEELSPPSAYEGPIIDVHLHSFPEGSPMYGKTHPTTLRGESYEGVTSREAQMRETLAKMEEHNVVKAVVGGGKAWKELAPDKILVGSDEEMSLDVLRQEYDAGNLDVMGEMAPFYDQILADDPALIPVFDLADELGIPVGFHILPGGPNGGLYSFPEMLPGMRAVNAHPMQIEEVLVAHPDMKVYLMHGGWPFVDEVKALMYMHPQLYVDVAVINWILPEKEFHNYLADLIDAGFGDRIMYGTDQMVWPEVMDLGIDAVNSAPITDQQKADIFYHNAAEFLGLSEQERAAHNNATE